METIRTHKEIIEDEWYHVRHSGEIPEIALHSSLHYLTEDEEGPQIILDETDTRLLLEAAMERYGEIIFRDIESSNRDTAMYRGVLRTIANWRRLKRFCERHHMNPQKIKAEVAGRLFIFLHQEIEDVQSGRRATSINCTYEELFSFIVEMGLPLPDWIEDFKRICPVV